MIQINPRHPDRDRIYALLQKHLLPDHTWFMTSGSSGETKAVALSHNALMASAEAVNRHLDVTPKDKWLNALPLFHVGGVGIQMRAQLSGSPVIITKWDPALFADQIAQHLITLTSLVPTQVYDLVQQQIEAPPSLRAAIVGGGALSPHLYAKAQMLKWPLLPSYGLTECSSQVGTATRNSPHLKLLSHIEAGINDQGFLMIKSPALLTTYAKITNDTIRLEDPKTNGWFTTEDKATINACLEIHGRNTDFVKISGESVDLKKLSELLEGECVLFTVPDERLGHTLHLAYTSATPITNLLEKYHARVLPFERIKQTHLVPYIPRCPLGKVLAGELKKLIFN